MSMQEFQLFGAGRGAIYIGNRRVLPTPSGPGEGQKRILISILNRRFPHRIMDMTRIVIDILRWRRCPGDGATRIVFPRTSRDRTERKFWPLVSFFGTRQAAGSRHLRAGPQAHRPNEAQNNESLVNLGAAA
jgi:hypothetical protein